MAFAGSVAAVICCSVAAECLVVVVALFMLPNLFVECPIATRWASMLLSVPLVPAPPGIPATPVLKSDASPSLPLVILCRGHCMCHKSCRSCRYLESFLTTHTLGETLFCLALVLLLCALLS